MNPIELQMSLARAWLGALDAGMRSVANVCQLAGQNYAASVGQAALSAKPASPTPFGPFSLGMWSPFAGFGSVANPFMPTATSPFNWFGMPPSALSLWSGFARPQLPFSIPALGFFPAAAFSAPTRPTPMDDIVSAAYRTASGYAAAAVITALQNHTVKGASNGWHWPMPTWPGNLRLH